MSVLRKAIQPVLRKPLHGPFEAPYADLRAQTIAAFTAGEDFVETDGLVADYRFLEGSGTTVADQTGTTGDIDTTTPTTPNFSWVSTGGRTAAGLIQTPSITGARTVVLLYRVPPDDAGAGFVISGGSASGAGMLLPESITPADSWKISHGSGPVDIKARTTGATKSINTGGWKVVFRELDVSYNSPFGLGGRHSTTTSRCDQFDVRWCGVYNRVLTATERDDIYLRLRYVLSNYDEYLDYRDCPTQIPGILLWGQSNADGRALISNLSSGDQAADYSHIRIGQNGLVSGPDKTADAMTLGGDHNEKSTLEFGPEVGIALSGAADLFISKTAEGSKFLAPSSDANVTPGNTFSTQELATENAWGKPLPGFMYQSAALRDSGIGVNLKALCWMQGEQDAEHTSTADVYETELENLVAAIKTYTGYNPKAIIARIYDQASPTNATALATVRTAQANVVDTLNAAEAGSAALINTDDLTLSDTVHFDAAGMKTLGERFFAEIP